MLEISANMADGGDGRIQKMEVDYSETVDRRIPECEELAKVGYIHVFSIESQKKRQMYPFE